jgi:hypothetical protein
VSRERADDGGRRRQQAGGHRHPSQLLTLDAASTAKAHYQRGDVDQDGELGKIRAAMPLTRTRPAKPGAASGLMTGWSGPFSSPALSGSPSRKTIGTAQ